MKITLVEKVPVPRKLKAGQRKYPLNVLKPGDFFVVRATGKEDINKINRSLGVLACHNGGKYSVHKQGVRSVKVKRIS